MFVIKNQLENLSLTSFEPSRTQSKRRKKLKASVKWTAEIGLEGRNVDLCPTRVTRVSKGARCGGERVVNKHRKGRT